MWHGGVGGVPLVVQFGLVGRHDVAKLLLESRLELLCVSVAVAVVPAVHFQVKAEEWK